MEKEYNEKMIKVEKIVNDINIKTLTKKEQVLIELNIINKVYFD